MGGFSDRQNNDCVRVGLPTFGARAVRASDSRIRLAQARSSTTPSGLRECLRVPGAPQASPRARDVSCALQLSSRLQCLQIGQQRRALLGPGLTVKVYAVRGCDRCRYRVTTFVFLGVRLHALEELDVMINHFFERRGAVVLEV